MSKNRRPNPKKNKAARRKRVPQTFRSLSCSALVMQLGSIDDQFNRFVSAALGEHQAKFGSVEPGDADRCISRHPLPLIFRQSSTDERTAIRDLVIITDTSARRVTTVAMLDAEFETIKKRDGTVGSFAEIGASSSSGPTMSLTSL